MFAQSTTEPCDFLDIFSRFWPFEPHFLKNYFLIKSLIKDLSKIDRENRSLKKFPKIETLILHKKQIATSNPNSKVQQVAITAVLYSLNRNFANIHK